MVTKRIIRGVLVFCIAIPFIFTAELSSEEIPFPRLTLPIGVTLADWGYVFPSEIPYVSLMVEVGVLTGG